MDFNAVNACVFAHLCRLAERFDKLVNLVYGHRARRHFVAPTVRIGTCAHSELIDVDERFCDCTQNFVCGKHFHHRADCKRTAETCGELYKHLCARFVKLIHKRFEMSERAFALVKPISADNVSDGRNTRQNKADVVLCPIEQEVCGFFVEVMRFHPTED